MADIVIDNYLSTGQHEVFARDINERIEYLTQLVRKSEQEGDEPFDEDVSELNALVEFRTEVEAQTGKKFAEVTIVPEDEFEDHARQTLRDEVDGVELIEHWVDWEGVADDLRTSYFELDFGDDAVFVR